MTGLIALVYAITEAAAHGVARWQVPVAAVLGVLGLWLFVRRQLRLADPLLDVRLFADRRFTAAVLGALIAVFGLAGVVFFMSQYLQLVRGLSPLTAGLAELPAFAGAAAASILTTRLTRSAGPRAALVGGMALLGLALGALGLLRQDTSFLLLAVIFLAVGAAEGLVYTLSADLVLSAAPPARSGAASAVSETAYELGTALGIALFGSVLTAVYRGGGTPPGVDAETAARAHESLGSAVAAAQHLPGEAGQALVGMAQEAFVRGIGLAAVLAAVLVLLGAGLAWRLLRRV